MDDPERPPNGAPAGSDAADLVDPQVAATRRVTSEAPEADQAPSDSALQADATQQTPGYRSEPPTEGNKISGVQGKEADHEDNDEPDDPDLDLLFNKLESTEEPSGSTVAGRDAFVARERIELVRGNKYEAARDLNLLSPTEEPKFDALQRRILERSSALFVPPEGFRAVRNDKESLMRHRVVLVHGPDHAGKWTCAVNIALMLRECDDTLVRIAQYSRPRDSAIPLVEALNSEPFWEFGQNSVLLLRDCFERNVRREELEPAQVQDLTELLHDSNSFLVLTGDVSREQLASMAVVSLAAQVDDLREVLEKNLRYQMNHEDLRLSDSTVETILDSRLWTKLQEALATPFHIHQFCSKLASVVSEAEDTPTFKHRLVSLAVEVAIGGREAARDWFDALLPNEKLLALLVYLFPVADRRWLESRARRLVERFRANGFNWLADPREQGLEDARERIHAIEQGGRLEFDDRLYEGELARQVENRQHLLWDALEPMFALEPGNEWREGWKRQALGIAMGRLGVHDLGRLMVALEGMATDEHRQRAVVPGYVFQELLRRDPSIAGSRVFRTLRSWIRSPNHRLMWAAGAALWRVYLAGRDSEDEEQKQSTKLQVFELIRQLGNRLATFRVPAPERGGEEGGRKVQDATEGSGSEERRRIWRTNFECVVEAMRQIALVDPDRTAAELRDWLLSGNTSLGGLARVTIRVVYETFAMRQFKPTEAQKLAFLRLIPSLLRNASGESRDVETVFLTLRGWLRWPSFPERILGELFHVATFSNTQVRARLRSIVSRVWLDHEPAVALEVARKVIRSSTRGQRKSEAQKERATQRLAGYWCEGTEDAAHWIAQTLIARCYAVDGALPSLPCVGRGVAVVDPALLLPTRDAPGTSAGALWSLLAFLESRLDLALLPLGETQWIELLDSSVSAVEPLPRFAGHRLLVPGLEKVPLSHSENVFVLAARKPHDFSDLPGQPWLHSLHFLGPSDEAGAIEEGRQNGYVHLELSWPPSPQELEATVSALEGGWARALASESGEHWQELARAFDVECLDLTTCMAQLEGLARDVEAPLAAPDPHDDPVWRILALTLWLAATDLPTCLEWIGSWLTLEEEAPEVPAKRVVGAAAASALIRLFTAYPPDPSGVDRAPTLLFEALAEPLALQGSDGVDAVLRLLSHWLEEPLWAEYLAGDVQEGRGRLERWAAEHLEDRPGLARELSERLDACRSAGVTGQSWEALAAVVGRLKALRALERPQGLPEIGTDQRYAILVFDTGSSDENLRRRLAAVTVELHRELAGSGDPSEEATAPPSQPFLVPAIYRLGDIRPFWTDTQVVPTPERLLPRGMVLPSVIGPLFASLDERRGQVAVVVLISGAAPLDLDDWSLSAWWRKVKIYGDGSSPSVPSFGILPEPMKLTGFDNEQDQVRTEAAEIVAFLQKPHKPEPLGATEAPGSGSGAAVT